MKKVTYTPLIIVFGAITAIWLAYAAFIAMCTKDYATKGQFGDSFGALNTFFSGLAFAAFVYTVLLQRHELELQRNEMALTREELAGQKAQLVLQNNLTILSARLSALPVLLDQLSLSIQKLGGEFENWTEDSFTLEELSDKIKHSRSMADKFSKEYDKAVEAFEERGRKDDIFRTTEKQIRHLSSQKTRHNAAIPKLESLLRLREDLDDIYLKLKKSNQ